MKSKQITDLLKEDSWAVAEGLHEEKPLVIRFRDGLRAINDFTGYPLLLEVTWDYVALEEDGLPDEADSAAMELFEDRMVAALEHDGHAVLTAVLTSNGSRQWLFYTSDVDACGERVEEMPQEPEPYPIELGFEEDPEWEYLRETILAGCVDEED